jgi:hypothetical protein
MASGILVLILMLCAISAILAGMGVFSNNRPPDPRLAQLIDDLDDLKGVVNQIQKQLLQIERKLDKDLKDSKNELRETLEQMAERIEKRVGELGE